MPYVIRVKLIKQTDGFGLAFQKLKSLPCARVRAIIPGGPADRINLIRVGDIIQSINGIDVSRMCFESINDILNSVPISQAVVFLMRCPSGCRTFIQTRLQSGGIRVKERVSETKYSCLPLTMSKTTHMADHRDVLNDENFSVTGNAIVRRPKSFPELPCSTSRADVPECTAKVSRRGNVRIEQNHPEKNNNVKLNKTICLKNMMDDGEVFADTLHQSAIQPVGCDATACLGSHMTPTKNHLKERRQILEEAHDFISLYYKSLKRYDAAAHESRWKSVKHSIEQTGTYHLSSSELSFGVKTAWRNAGRCIGRMQWSKLQVFDARHIKTTGVMFDALCTHIKYATNKGTIRSAITVFPQRTDGEHDFRIWNPLFIAYAGYRQEDGTVIGDPKQAAFTEICLKLGWSGKGTPHDVLPLVLQANGQDPEYFELPSDIVLEVDICHPQYPCFQEFGYKWFAVPGVSDMMLDCGGIQFTAIPFSGWYMSTEIVRDFTDSGRYNVLETVANGMGLTTSSNSTLWKDRAMVEFNYAVLHSFQKNNVTITDHHSASESFMKFMKREETTRGGCPADWVWIVPPMGASTTQVFHQEMLNYRLKPSYEYQTPAWENYVWKTASADNSTSAIRATIRKKKLKFRDVARAVKFSAHLMSMALAKRVKCTVLYATETGKSQQFAKTLCGVFNRSFDVKICCMEDYNVLELEHEPLVIFITSTFGNGDPPDNGQTFSEELLKLRQEWTLPSGREHLSSSLGTRPRETTVRSLVRKRSDLSSHTTGICLPSDQISGSLDEEVNLLINVKFAVFGLGSSAYPNFCAFAHYLNQSMGMLGAERICAIGLGDELCGQEQSFTEWMGKVYKAACETFCFNDCDVNVGGSYSVQMDGKGWSPSNFALASCVGEVIAKDKALSILHKKNVSTVLMKSSKNLHPGESGKETLAIQFDCGDQLSFSPGDHMAIFPVNHSRMVEELLYRIHSHNSPETVVQIQVASKTMTPFGAMTKWQPFDRLPFPTNLREVFTYYLDITSPPSVALLKHLASLATDEKEKRAIELIFMDEHRYEDWRYTVQPTLLEFLESYPSVRPPASLLMSQLPLLKYRYYSVSSSLDVHPCEIHLTVAVVKYRQQGTGKLLKGLCSNWLNSLSPGDSVSCFIRRSTFHLPPDPSLPLILVGPGTGIAPFRGFWQQRQVDLNRSNEKDRFGEVSLYFGCRKSEDQLYQDELRKAQQNGVLKNVYVALSREIALPKTYVQHMLQTRSSDVYSALVTKKGHIYICGDVSMANDVCQTLETIIAKEGGFTTVHAQARVDSLRDAGRIHEDIFGNLFQSPEASSLKREKSRQRRRTSKET